MRIRQYYDLPNAGDYAVAGLKLLIFAGFVAALWAIVNRLTSFDDHEELFVNCNAPFALRRYGLLIAQAIATVGLISVKTDDWTSDVLWLVGGGLWSAVLLLASRPLVDRLITDNGAHADDLRSKDQAEAVVQAAFYVAFGWIINAGLSGWAPSVGTGLTAIVVFTLLGCIVLLSVYFLLGRVGQYRGIHRYIRGGSTAAALVAGGVVVSLGLALHNAIAGDFVNWPAAFIGFTVTLAATLVAFLVLSWLVDKVVVTSAPMQQVIRDNQVLAGGMMAVAVLAIGVALAVIPI